MKVIIRYIVKSHNNYIYLIDSIFKTIYKFIITGKCRGAILNFHLNQNSTLLIPIRVQTLEKSFYLELFWLSALYFWYQLLILGIQRILNLALNCLKMIRILMQWGLTWISLPSMEEHMLVIKIQPIDTNNLKKNSKQYKNTMKMKKHHSS